jgi:hypothetical protein
MIHLSIDDIKQQYVCWMIGGELKHGKERENLQQFWLKKCEFFKFYYSKISILNYVNQIHPPSSSSSSSKYQNFIPLARSILF